MICWYLIRPKIVELGSFPGLARAAELEEAGR